MRIIIATVKSWNMKNAKIFKDINSEIETYIFSEKKDLTLQRLSEINPEYVFFPHWSWIIPEEIYNNYTCIVFHMTNLPYGRGGSPLQNLIERGIKNTKISGLKVDGGIDTGDIFIKKELNLNGTAEEIYIRASKIIFNDMIPKIIEEEIIPNQQLGEIVEFKRRKPNQGEILPCFGIEKIYNYIRMLDAEDYPKAFINFGDYKIEFSRASLKSGRIIADVEIKEVQNDE